MYEKLMQENIESLHRMIKSISERMDVLSARISDLNKLHYESIKNNNK